MLLITSKILLFTHIVVLAPFPVTGFDKEAILAAEQCFPEIFKAESDAEAIVQLILDIRTVDRSRSDTTGVQCGAVTKEGAEIVELLRWAVEALNRDHGDVFGEPVNASFVPAVRFGLEVSDSCETPSLATKHALDAYQKSYLPQWRCVLNETKLDVGGILGLSAPLALNTVVEVLRGSDQEPVIPLISIDGSGSFVETQKHRSSNNLLQVYPSVSELTEAMLATVKQLNWHQVALVYSECDFGQKGKAMILQMAKQLDICVSQVEVIPGTFSEDINIEDPLFSFDALFQRLSSNLPHAPAVLLFASKKATKRFLMEMLSEERKTKGRDQRQKLVFVFPDTIGRRIDTVSETDTKNAPGKTLFAVSSDAPASILEFSEYLKALVSFEPSFATSWYREFYQSKHRCRFKGSNRGNNDDIPMCSPESSEDLTAGTNNPGLVLALDALLLYAVALKEAWSRKCNGEHGVCLELMQMAKKEFLELVADSEVDYGQNVRAPASLAGRKVRLTSRSVHVYEFTSAASIRGSHFSQVFSYENGRFGLIKHPTFYKNVSGRISETTMPPKSDCAEHCRCVLESPESSFQHLYNPGSLVLTAVLPVHDALESGYSCGSIRSVGGYQYVDAFLYALKQINDRNGPFHGILPGITLGHLVLDSCNSPLKADYELSGILSNRINVVNAKDGSRLDPRTLAAIFGAIFSNVTEQLNALTAFGNLPFFTVGFYKNNEKSLSTTTVHSSLSMRSRLKLVVQLLEQLNWDYVQVLHAASPFGMSSASTFKQLLVNSSVCVAQEVPIEDIAELPLRILQRESDVVIVLEDDPEAVKAVLVALHHVAMERLSSANNSKVLSVVLPLLNFDTEELLLQIPPEFLPEIVALGDSAGPMPSYVRHLTSQKLTNEDLLDNPWLVEFLETGLNCSLSATTMLGKLEPCKTNISPEQNPFANFDAATSNAIINSVYSFAFALHELLQQRCSPDYDGLCAQFWKQNDEHTLSSSLLKLVKETKFKDETGNPFAYLPEFDFDGFQQLQLVYRSSEHNETRLQTIGQLAMLHDEQQTFSVDFELSDKSLRQLRRPTPVCADQKICAECPHLRAHVAATSSLEINGDQNNNSGMKQLQKNLLLIPSPQNLFIGALLPIHQRSLHSSTPFSCGPISEDGIQLLEAFLWALDTINRNPLILNNISIGAIIADTCGSVAQTFEDLSQLFGNATGAAEENLDQFIGFTLDPHNAPALEAAGVLGSLSVTNIAVASSTDALNDAERYFYTLRTSLPDKLKFRAIGELFSAMNWSYASVLCSEAAHPNTPTNFCRQMLQASDYFDHVCFGLSEFLPSSSSSSFKSQAQAEKLAKLVLKQVSRGAKAVLILPESNAEFRLFLAALEQSVVSSGLEPVNVQLIVDATALNLRSLLSDKIGSSSMLLLGSMLLEYDAGEVLAFEKHMRALNTSNNLRNRWWLEYLKQKLDCLQHSDNSCSGFDIDARRSFASNPKALPLIEAVCALSLGLDALYQNSCASHEKDVNCEQQFTKMPGFREKMLKAVANAAFNRPDNAELSFEFSEDGWANTGLRFVNVQLDSDASVKLQKVATFAVDRLNFEKMPFTYLQDRPLNLNELKSVCIANSEQCHKECRSIVHANVLKPEEHGTSTTVGTTVAQPQTLTTDLPHQLTTTVLQQSLSSLVANEFRDPFFLAPSPHRLLIVAVLPLHSAGTNPFSCGNKLLSENVQLLEAFLWSVDRWNRDVALSGGVQLGALVLDSCSSAQKAVRDLANLMTNQVKFSVIDDKLSINGAVDTLAVLSSPNAKEAIAIGNLLSSFNVTSISPAASEASLLLNKTVPVLSNYSLSTSVPLQLQIGAIVHLLQNVSWNTVAVWYSDGDGDFGTTAQRHFIAAAAHENICVPFVNVVSLQHCYGNAATELQQQLLKTLQAMKQGGVKGGVLWLKERQLSCFFKALEAAKAKGTISSGEFVWFIHAELPTMDSTPISDHLGSDGIVWLQYDNPVVSSFKTHWRKLGPSISYGGNPWLSEMLQKTFQCNEEHSECANMSLVNVEYKQNAYVLNTINAVSSIVHGLQQLRRQLCGTVKNNNSAMVEQCVELLRKKDLSLRPQLFDNIRGAEFKDIVGQSFSFTPNGYSNRGLKIMNMRRSGSTYELKQAGYYYHNDAALRLSLVGFDDGNKQVLLSSAPSQCSSKQLCEMCQQILKQIGDSTLPSFASMSTLARNVTSAVAVTYESTTKKQQQSDPPLLPQSASAIDETEIFDAGNSMFYVGGIFPVHYRSSSSSLTCGAINRLTGFQRLAAFLFAIQEVNSDQHLLPGIQLGAVAMDSCGSSERAFAKMFEFLANSSSSNTMELVSVTGLGHVEQSSLQLHDIFRDAKLPLISTTSLPLQVRDDVTAFGTVPSDETQVRLMGDVISHMQWSYISVVSENETLLQATATYFEHHVVTTLRRCVAKHVRLSRHSSVEQTRVAVRQLVTATGANVVAVFLSDSSFVKLIKALSTEQVVAGRFMFFLPFHEEWTFDTSFLTALAHMNQGLLTMEVQRYQPTRFVQHFLKLSPNHHGWLPDHWFREFWQSTFNCSLNHENAAHVRLSNACKSIDSLQRSPHMKISPSVLQTILAVHASAWALKKFLATNCPGKHGVFSLRNCTTNDPRKRFLDALRSVNFNYSVEPGAEAMQVRFDKHGFLQQEYSIRMLTKMPDGNFKYEPVGNWRSDSGLDQFHREKIVLQDSLGATISPTSQCISASCFYCSLQSVPHHVPLPHLDENFASIWGIFAASLAAVGMLLCAVCTLYFLISFPTSYGTTVLGYMILFGIFLVYGLSLSFVLSPGEIVCAVRRYGTGVCWSFIFAPMFVKVAYTCHIKGREGKLVSGLQQSSFGILFTIAFGVALVQAIIELEWFILQQPKPLTLVVSSTSAGDHLESAIWRCAPGEAFETELILSLLYIMFLVFVTALLSVLGWNVNVHDKESRWILVSCLLTGIIWTMWAMIINLSSSYALKDPTTAIAFSLNASLILACLFMRKAYLFTKYRNEAKKHPDNLSYQASMADGGSLYGTKLYLSPSGIHSVNPLLIGRKTLTTADIGDPVYFQNSAYDGGSEFDVAVMKNDKKNNEKVALYNGSNTQTQTEVSNRF